LPASTNKSYQNVNQIDEFFLVSTQPLTPAPALNRPAMRASPDPIEAVRDPIDLWQAYGPAAPRRPSPMREIP
jgi:hypothetical protein